MRMIDQTFKQDGGIGTYLDKTLEPYYEAHTMTLTNFDRLIFDCIFFLVVILLVFQMFLSVIINHTGLVVCFVTGLLFSSSMHSALP